MSEPSSQPQPGLPQIPKYELLEEIGHGGMATVYRARDPRLSRDVAVKVIHRHLRENTEVATRFVAEARAAAKLRHPGIVEVFDVSNEEDSERFLVVELLRGCTLRKLLLTHRDMPAEIGACIVRELCDAIEHAHESGIIHRDIKPENVLVELPGDRASVSTPPQPPPSSGERTEIDVRPPAISEIVTADPSDTQQSVRDVAISKGTHNDGKPRPSKPRSMPDSAKRTKASDPGVVIKITDFGIAKILDAQGMTSTGQVLGSPAHMAPEQIEGGDVDARTDVFALGVLMYECLVGHLPFEGKNPAQVLRKVLEGIYAPVDRERPTTGGRWSRIVAAALARGAEERTASPAALAEQIVAELGALGITDGRAEINAYFADPKAYAEAHVERLVPKLIARGEAARKTGDIPSAAADFNRALALRPSDLAILKRVGGLATTASRRVLLKRAATAIGGGLLAGLVAFGFTRLSKSSTAETQHPSTQREPNGADPSESAPEPVGTNDPADIPMNIDPSTIGPLPTSSARSGRTAAHPVIVAPTASAAVDPAAKKVSFQVFPQGANFFLDGKVENWAGNVFSLKPGPHSVKATIDDDCCKSPKEVTITVNDKPEQFYRVVLDLNPARLEVKGRAGSFSCQATGLSGAIPSTLSLKMGELTKNDSCKFESLDKSEHKSQPVRFSAGKTSVIQF